MRDCKREMNEFLKSIGAECIIEYGGVARNVLWGDQVKRRWYDVTLKTPRGKMQYVFWDSIKNTEIAKMELSAYTEKYLKCRLSDMRYFDRKRAEKQLQQLKEDAELTAYDVITPWKNTMLGHLRTFVQTLGIARTAALQNKFI